MTRIMPLLAEMRLLATGEKEAGQASECLAKLILAGSKDQLG